MTPSSADRVDVNAALVERRSLLNFVNSASLDDLTNLQYDWASGSVVPGSDVYDIFLEHGLVENEEDGPRLTRAGFLVLGRLVLQFPQIEAKESLEFGSYSFKKRIKTGKNSSIYFAEHSVLGHSVLAKVLRPGASENIVEAIKVMTALPKGTRIVRPIDIIETEHSDAAGKELKLNCLIYPVVAGISLRKFLAQKSYHLNSHVALAFVRQIGSALAELEAIGTYHGDLHDENILVEEDADGRLSFHLIDVSFGAMGSMSHEECVNSDMTSFRQHVWRILSAQKSFLPRMSLRKFLGTNQFRKLTRIMSGEVATFSEVMSTLGENSSERAFRDQKSKFRNEKFGRPTTFRLQRYEEIIDPSEAAKLFVPFPELMSQVSDFSNNFISGNRGSGKSTYLAALGFFPHSQNSNVDFRDLFGVYFPCRQGEFKSLTGATDWTETESQTFAAHLVVVKTMRRTLEAVSQGVEVGRLGNPSDLGQLRKFLNEVVPPPGIISVEGDLLPDLRNFASTMIRIEMELVSGNNLASFSSREKLVPASLIDFFRVIRRTFPELSGARFHLLFDDAGAPNLNKQFQRVLCDLILTSNPIYCVKFSAEKFTFEFESSLGKVPENGHDYFEQDISQTLFVGSRNARIAREELEQYFRQIVDQRLEHFGYQSHQIVDYLGDNPNIVKPLIGLLAASRRDARYTGWTAVWNIAERTPRNLLELVSEIFAYAGIEPNTPPRQVSMAVQDKAIRSVSLKRLQSLSQIPGYIMIGGQKVSLGRKLYEIAASIGSIFRAYLKEEQGKQHKRQHLAIERNDSGEISEEATIVLEKLISFGVLDDSKAEYARDDGVMKPIYVLNRIFCPAFNIIFRRDEHLRLSQKKLELLLLDPQSFVKVGTKRLAKLHTASEFDEGLFGYDIYE